MTGWTTVGPGVLAYRHAELDLTTGLVLGRDRCLVVDTGGHAAWGAAWAAAVRERTALPWTVAITHAHFDHAFGTVAFAGAEVWADAECARELRDDAESYRSGGLAHPGMDTQALRDTEVVVPEHAVSGIATVDLGGRTVLLASVGPGHTGHDLAVLVPDTRALFAGDLVERAVTGSFSAESFGPDCDLRAWPDALGELLDQQPRLVVPGHGDPVDAKFVRRQRDELRALLELRNAVVAGEITAREAETRSPLPPSVTAAALTAGCS